MSILDDDILDDNLVITHTLNNVEDKDIPALLQAWYDVFKYVCYDEDFDNDYIIALLALFKNEFIINKRVYKSGSDVVEVINTAYDSKSVIDDWIVDFMKGYKIPSEEVFITFIIGILNLSWVSIKLFQQGHFNNDYSIWIKIDREYNFTPVATKYEFYKGNIYHLLKSKGIINR